MGLPSKFDKRVKKQLGLRAVWLPGTVIELGDIRRQERYYIRCFEVLQPDDFTFKQWIFLTWIDVPFAEEVDVPDLSVSVAGHQGDFCQRLF